MDAPNLSVGVTDILRTGGLLALSINFAHCIIWITSEVAVNGVNRVGFVSAESRTPSLVEHQAKLQQTLPPALVNATRVLLVNYPTTTALRRFINEHLQALQKKLWAKKILLRFSEQTAVQILRESQGDNEKVSRR